LQYFYPKNEKTELQSQTIFAPSFVGRFFHIFSVRVKIEHSVRKTIFWDNKFKKHFLLLHYAIANY